MGRFGQNWTNIFAASIHDIMHTRKARCFADGEIRGDHLMNNCTSAEQQRPLCVVVGWHRRRKTIKLHTKSVSQNLSQIIIYLPTKGNEVVGTITRDGQ